ncbi:hypothetical protein ACGC1H_005647 [Rhizoctonia solani]|uniref:MYND-type domain-containing protein n=1 Tax=Rhizoctonia solani TaxID=456999 RepID=A0A8H2XJ87_9AGAM|nr:unnamed protein product [Rhizoctonia solani]
MLASRSRQPYAVKQLLEWGPTLPQYMPAFEERLTESFDKYMANEENVFEVPNGLIPLDLLETALAVGENMHKVGFQRGDKVFPVLMSAIREYTKLLGGGIFEHYYGFLCIRHLIRMVCIGAMRQCKRFDNFFNDTKPDAPRQEVTEALAARALDSMITVLCAENAAVVENLLGILSKSGHAFVIDGGLSYDDVEFLIKALWKDRKSLVPLRRCGLLPGLPALLFVLSEMTVLSRSPITNRPWLALEDVIFRCYLGDTSNPEREILRQLCVYIESFVLNRYHSISMDYEPVDEDDNRKVTEAYCAVFAPPMKLSLAAVIQLDIATMLFRWALDLLGWESKGPLIGEDLVPHIVKGAMARLTLEIDREWSGPMLEKRRAFTNRYAGEVFGYTSLLVINNQIQTGDVQQEVVQMLMEFDFYGLAGRVLMFVTRETSSKPPSFDEVCACFRQMNKAFKLLPDPSPEQLASIALVWRKVYLNLVYHEQSAFTRAPRELIGQAMEAWDVLRPPSVERPPDLFECMNPRCAIRIIYMVPPEAGMLCKGCEKVMYCSPRCQQIHWSLHTSDAHRLRCH